MQRPPAGRVPTQPLRVDCAAGTRAQRWSGDVIEKILRHCGLGCPSSPRAPHGEAGSVHDVASSDEPRELTFVAEATFWATC